MNDTPRLTDRLRAPIARRRLVAAAALCTATLPLAAWSQAKPSRAETINYINNVLAKAHGFVLNHTSVGSPRITAFRLAHDAGARSYSLEMVEELVNDQQPGVRMIAHVTTRRHGWNLNRMQALDDLEAFLTINGADSRHPDLRRVKIDFPAGSVRQLRTQSVWQNGRFLETRTLTDNTINFVTLFYRAAEPDDGKRLRNAFLRLKELDAEEPDPFLK